MPNRFPRAAGDGFSRFRIRNTAAEMESYNMKTKIIALVTAMLLLVLAGGCGKASLEVEGLPELSPSSLQAPTPAASAKSITASFAGLSQPELTAPFEQSAPVNVEFSEKAQGAVCQDGYLYVLSNSEFMILSAQEGVVSLLSTTNFASEREDTGDTYEYSSAIYVQDDRLAVVTNLTSFSGDEGLNASTRSYAKIYDISDRTAPVQLADLGQDGVYQDSAVSDGVLCLISVDSFRVDGETLPLPSFVDNGAEFSVPESRIYLCEKPGSAAYTVVSAISLSDGRRTDVCAFTDSHLYTAVSESSIYLARSVSLSAEGESHTVDQYTVTDHATSVVTEIKKLSFADSLSLLNSYNVEGQVLALDAHGTELRLVTAVSRSRYQIFTDEKYGWSNRLDGEQVQQSLLWVLGENMQPLLQSDTLLPDNGIAAIAFSADRCYAAAQGEETLLVSVDLSDPAAAKAVNVSGLGTSMNHLISAGGTLLNLTAADGRLFLSRLSEDGTFGEAYRVDAYSGEGFAAACSENAQTALVAFDGGVHLLQLGEEIREIGMPKISVHSGTAFLFEGNYLYACAPDSVCAVDLQTAEVTTLLSFGVG